MSESSNAPLYSPVSAEPFYQTWIKALTRPSEQTYAALAASPGASPNKAYLWIFVTGLVNMFVAFALQGVTLRNYLPPEYQDQLGSASPSFLSIICGAPISAAVSVLFFAIGVALFQWIAGLFGGKGTYGQLAYVFGAIAAPANLISAVFTLLTAIPFVGVLFGLVAGLFGLYVLFLEIAAVKGVNQFGWGQAVGTVLLPSLVIGVLCCCLVFGLLYFLAPAVGDVFSTINRSLAP